VEDLGAALPAQAPRRHGGRIKMAAARARVLGLGSAGREIWWCEEEDERRSEAECRRCVGLVRLVWFGPACVGGKKFPRHSFIPLRFVFGVLPSIPNSATDTVRVHRTDSVA
jgi:hypothetical protein